MVTSEARANMAALLALLRADASAEDERVASFVAKVVE
jgi:hypothetical protein